MLEYKEIGLGGIRTSAITDQGWQTVRHDRAAVRPDRPEGGADRSRSIARQDRREIYPGRYQTGHERQYVTQLFQTAIVSVFTGGPMAVWRFALSSNPLGDLASACVQLSSNRFIPAGNPFPTNSRNVYLATGGDKSKLAPYEKSIPLFRQLSASRIRRFDPCLAKRGAVSCQLGRLF